MKRPYTVGDIFEDMIGGLATWQRFPISTTYSFGLDTDRYEIIEKPNWRIKKLEGEIEALERERKTWDSHYKELIEQKREELEKQRSRKLKSG